ncbi:unnamed protein product, partial [Allacma fusca]
IWKGLYSY